ncbi:hypothetical protein TruAng_008085 [Truncatella angustata]|nr:hypothetical protein TruAng_008085 [Truncatella angustata]
MRAKEILLNEGYDESLFKVLDVNGGKHRGKNSNDLVIYAEGLLDEKYTVEIETISTNAKVEGDDDGRVRCPLYYVLQTVVRNTKDGTGCEVDSTIKSMHWTRKLARAAITSALFDDKTSKDGFVEYAEHADGMNGPEGPDCMGPWGPDVIIRAVKENGETNFVSIKRCN